MRLRLASFTLPVAVVLSLPIALAGCASGVSEPGASVKTPTSSASPTATAPVTTAPDADAQESADGADQIDDVVRFTFDCYVEMPSDINPMGATAPFATWEDVWANPDITACDANRSGTVVTPEQNHAVDLAIDAYAGDREYALEGLSIQCAITNNGYVAMDVLVGNQISEVRGILALCPDRPGAAALEAALARS